MTSVSLQVFISHNKELLASSLPDNTSQVPGIASIQNSSLTFNNGQVEHVDSIVLCTGYTINFPFLHEDCSIRVNDNRVTPLYKHFINIEHPTMGIWGIPFIICPFPFFDSEVLMFLTFLEGKCSLPTKDEMYRDEEEEFLGRRNAGLPVRFSHRMGPLQWTYQDELFKIGGIPGTNVPHVIRNLYDYVHETRVKDLMHYKDLSYVIRGNTFSLAPSNRDET